MKPVCGAAPLWPFSYVWLGNPDDEELQDIVDLYRDQWKSFLARTRLRPNS